MKKIISLLLIAVMLFSTVITMAAGGVELPIIPIVTDFSISATDAECSAGGTFDIVINIDKNSGIKKAVFKIGCPEDITLKSVVQGTALSGLTMTVDKAVPSVTFEGNSPISTLGEAAILTFALDSGASKSEYSLTVNATDVQGENGYIPGAFATAGVTVQDVLMGDTNSDGKVDLKDITALRRALAGGYGVTVNDAASDVNGDGEVDLKDITYIRRALAGGYGVELQRVVRYSVCGTENCGIATDKDDTVFIAETDSNGEPVSLKLTDMGLDSYVGKTDDLMNFQLDVTLLGTRMTKAVVISNVRDITSIGYDSTKSYASINGVRYTWDNAPVLCTPDGNKREDVTVFGSNKKLTSDFTKLIDKAYRGRIVDYDADGKDDIFVIAPKVAYIVNGFYDKANGAYDEPYDKGNVTYVNCTALDFSSTLSVPVSYLTTSLEKGDIFVGALFNTTLYAEKATAVETYATGFGINGKVNLKNVGAVRYENVTVVGAETVNITENDFGANNIRCYYVYNNELLAVTGQQSEYNVAVLCDVAKSGSRYIANILTPENGALVKKELLLHPSVAESLYNEYKLTYSGNKPVYNYKIISGYIQTSDGCMPIIDELPDDSFVIVPKGANLTYDSENCMYILTRGADVFKKVFLDENSSVFYRYTIESGDSAGFVNLRMYTKDTITSTAFTATTIDTTYLVKVNGCYVLVATMVDGKIE